MHPVPAAGGRACAGRVAFFAFALLPPPPGTAMAFDVQPGNGESCSATAIDGEGIVAADAESSSPTTWFVFGVNGTRNGTFRSPVLFAQPKGFIGLALSGNDTLVALWDDYGVMWNPSLPSTDVVLGLAYGPGVISVSATSAQLLKAGNAVDLVSAQGDACGKVTFPGVTSVAIGLDGSVVGSTGQQGCTKFVWRDVLR